MSSKAPWFSKQHIQHYIAVAHAVGITHHPYGLCIGADYHPKAKTHAHTRQVTYMDVYNATYSADKQAQNYFVQSNATLWDMGNTLVAASDSMLFLQSQLGASINETDSYQVWQQRCARTDML